MTTKSTALMILVLLASLSSGTRAQSDSTRVRPSAPPSAPSGPVIIVGGTPFPADVDWPIIKGGRPGDYLGPVVRRRLLDTLSAQRRRWERARPARYVIRVVDLDHCLVVKTRPRGSPEPDTFTLPRFIVHDTIVVAREEAAVPKALAQSCVLPWRVDDLFRDLARAMTDTTRNVGGIEYDPTYGFPREYWTAVSPARPSLLAVESFAPVPR